MPSAENSSALLEAITPHHLQQLALLLLEVLVVSLLLLGLYRLSRRWGLGVLFTALGTFQYLQVISAMSLYIEILPGIVISPGSVVLFSATVASVLMVYILDDVTTARRLIWGLIISNLALSGLGVLFGLHLANPTTINIYNLPTQFFLQDSRVLVAGTVALAGDVLLVVLAYELLSRKLETLFMRVALALLIVLVFDTLVFVTGAFYDSPRYVTLLISGILGKSFAAVLYAIALTAYLSLRAPVDRLRPEARLPAAKMLRSLMLELEHPSYDEEQRRIARAVGGAGDAIWEWDLVTNRVFHSRSWSVLLGEPDKRPAVRVADWTGRIHEDDRPAFDEAVAKHIAGETSSLEHEYRVRMASGEHCWVRSRGQVNRASDGTPLSIAGVHSDVGARRRMDALKNEFVSIAGHELRTPLASIRGALGLMAAGAVGEIPAKANELLVVAERNALRLTRLVDDVLDLDAIERGRMDLRLASIDGVAALEEAIANNHGYVMEKNVSCSIANEDSSAVNIEADADRLQQVLSNLLSNATKFSPDGGELETSVVRHGPMVRFTITDHGDGIPEEVRERIFEKFVRATGEASGMRNTGLGLAISKAIVEAHGGTIWFRTQRGVGTSFMFEVPGG